MREITLTRGKVALVDDEAYSQYLGVSRYRDGVRWVAQIKVPKGKVIYLGLFTEEAEAARTYDMAVTKLYTGYVKTNFGQQIGGSP